MKSKLNLDPKVVDSARQHAANIAHDMQDFIERHTTVSTERTVVRLLGVDGVDELDTPLPNVVVDQIREAGALPTGAAYLIGNAIVQTGKSPQEIAEDMAAGKLDITKLPTCSQKEAEEALRQVALDDVKVEKLATKTTASSNKPVSAVADDNTSLSALGIKEGSMTVYVDGVKKVINIGGK